MEGGGNFFFRGGFPPPVSPVAETLLRVSVGDFWMGGNAPPPEGGGGGGGNLERWGGGIARERFATQGRNSM